MRAYLHDNQPGDCRLPHDSGEALPTSYLTTLGILHYTFPPFLPHSASFLEILATARNYANRDKVTVSPEGLGDAYKEKFEAFYEEHMHEDEEIRYMLASKGNKGFFDVRDAEDRWVRIEAEEGDLLVLPAGIYHRFTVDEGDYIHAMRLYQAMPEWASLKRGEETEANSFRKAYVEARSKGFAAQEK